jgi:sugar phosphate isomerase/epimerase
LHNSPMIWLYTPPERRAEAEGIRKALEPQAQALIIGPSGQPAPEIDLGPEPDLAMALETCPPEMRPRACVSLAHDLPPGIDCLPCPVLGWNGGKGLEGRLPGEDKACALKLLDVVKGDYLPQWLPRVQVNLPLRDLLGRYRALAQALPLNLEVGLDAQALDDLGPDDLDEAKLMLQGRRITAHLTFMDLAPGSRDAKVRELSRKRLLAAADLAGQIKAGQAVAHLGFDYRTTPDVEDWVERAAPVFAELADALAQGGCRLALENVFEQNPGVHLLLVEAMAKLSSVETGFCLDSGHALAFSSTALQEWWAAFEPRIWELHLHDNRGSGDEHLPIGWGAVDWPWLVQAMARLGERPVLTLEPHREPHLWGSLRGMAKLFGAVR